jgi:hypothetical protein
MDGYRGLRGSEGSKPFDQDRTGKSQTGTDERLRVALTGGPGHQACMREAVSRGPICSIKIGRGGVRPGKQTATGAAAPLRGSEVTGVEVGAS